MIPRAVEALTMDADVDVLRAIDSDGAVHLIKRSNGAKKIARVRHSRHPCDLKENVQSQTKINDDDEEGTFAVFPTGLRRTTTRLLAEKAPPLGLY